MAESAQAASRESGLSWGDAGRTRFGLVGAIIGVIFASGIIPGFEVQDLEQALVAGILITVAGAVSRSLPVHLGHRTSLPRAADRA